MTGIIDVGGGLRDIYGAGVFDRLLCDGVDFDRLYGISAGSANIASFTARQFGRNYKFFNIYSNRRDYMGLYAFLKCGSFFNLDYVYSTLTNSDGENPLDFEQMTKYPGVITTIATRGWDGKPEYFSLNDYKQDDYSVIKGSCAIPVFCKPKKIHGREYFDGGLSDPLPVDKALSDGVDRLVVILTKPKEERMPETGNFALTHRLMPTYPEIAEEIYRRGKFYNDSLEKVIELEKEDKALIIAPEELFGVTTTSHPKDGMRKLYAEGFHDGGKIKDFIYNEK